MRTLVIVVLAVMIAITVFAVPEEMNYQGKLTDPDGVAIEGTVTIRFSLWDAETGGSEVWFENRTVDVFHGLFDVNLGEVNPITLLFEGDLWLQLAVEGEVLDSRQSMTAVPHAFRAAVAESLAGGVIVEHNDLTGIQGGTTDEYYHLSEIQHTQLHAPGSDNQNLFSSVTDGVDTYTASSETDGLRFVGTGGVDVNVDDVTGSITIDGASAGDNWGSQAVESDPSLTGDGTSGTELGIAADGVNDSHINWGHAADEVGADDVPYDNTASGLTALDVQTAIDELDDAIAASGDGWGSQVAQTTPRLDGDGTAGDPLDIAQQGAADGQVLKWNSASTAWQPDDDIDTDEQDLSLIGTNLNITDGTGVSLAGFMDNTDDQTDVEVPLTSTGDFAVVSGETEVHGALVDLDDAIVANQNDIATNTADIATNTADIATNTADIATNTADIATNTADIATNTGDIADNASDIATHIVADGDLDDTNELITAGSYTHGTHTLSITEAGTDWDIDLSALDNAGSDDQTDIEVPLTSTGDFAVVSGETEVHGALVDLDDAIIANQNDIATNTADIATNTADIATNTADIATNTGDIADNASDIGTHVAADGDLDDTNELITAGSYTHGTHTLTITEAGADWDIDLSALDNTGSDDQTDIEVPLTSTGDFAVVSGETEVHGALVDLDDAIVANQNDIATNTADIATNTADIATNTGDIADNASDIGTHVAADGDLDDTNELITAGSYTHGTHTLTITEAGADWDIDLSALDNAGSDDQTDVEVPLTSTGDFAVVSGETEVHGALVDLDDAIVANQNDIATNTADIATNTADIATNTADIATNAGDIAGHIAADGDLDDTNELQTIAGSGTSAFTLSDGGGTITLDGTGGVSVSRSGNTLTIDASSPGDDWGSQVASTTARLTGDGTAGSPLDIAQQSATPGQALKWNGSAWAPAADNVNDADSDPTNEHQDLGFVNGGSTYGYFEHTVTITDGSNATIRDYYDTDTDEQDLSLVGTNLNITDGTGVSLAGFMDNTDEQDLSYTASTRALGISGGTGVTLPLVTSADAGLAPSSGGGTTNYLRADGTWATPPGTATGDITSVVAGDGLIGGGSSGAVTLHANPDGSSLEIVSDALQVRALGIKDYHIDWGHGAGQVDADNVPFAPSTSGDWSMGIDPGDVDDALDQLANRVDGLEGGTGSVTSITGGTGISPAGPVSGAVDLSINTTELSLTGLSAPSATSLNVLYGTSASTAVEGNETATITAGTGLTGGISGDALGNGFSATLNVNFGGSGTATTASRSDHTHSTLTRGTGLTGSNYNGSSATTWAVNFGTTAGTVAEGDHTHAGTYDNYSAWNLQAEGGASTAISSGETVNFTGSGDATVTRTGNTIDIDVTATGTDDQNLSLVGTNLNIEDGTGVSLAGFMDNTDEQDLSYTASTRTMNITGGTGATLPLFTATEAGLAPLSGGSASNFLRADGIWAAPPGVSGSGTAGYTARWITSTSLGTSSIQDNGSGNIGINRVQSATYRLVTENASNAKAYLAGNTWGVYGEGDGAGVYGVTGSGPPYTYGILGHGSLGYGVYGSSPTVGVYGYGNGLGTSGVVGEGSTNGVRGVGTSTGVRGEGSSYGVYAQGGTYGVYATGSTYGVRSTGAFYGVYSTGTSFDIYASNSSADNYFAGYVGINKTSPSQRLDVVGRVRFNDPSYIDSRYLEIYSSTANYIQATNDLYINTSASAGGIILSTPSASPSGLQVKSGGTSGTQYVRFDANSQRVAIGPTTEPYTPSYKLEVDGLGAVTAIYGRYNATNYGYMGANGYGVYGRGSSYAGYFNGTLYGTGLINGNQLQSRVATGTAPLVVASQTLVTNLNADMVDGQHYDTDWSLWTDMTSHIRPTTADNFTIYDNSSSYYGQWYMASTNCSAIASLSYGSGTHAELCRGSTYSLYGSDGTHGAYGSGSTYGIYGINSTSANYYGYLGGASYGVYGTDGTNYGYLGSASYGLYASAEASSDYAGYFYGDVYMTGPNAQNTQRLYVYKYNNVASTEYGIYAYQYNNTDLTYCSAVYGYSGSSSDGSDYDVYGMRGAVKGYAYYGDPYSAGVAGISYHDYSRSAGVFGGDNSVNTEWGALGYRNSGGTDYGGYFNGGYTGGSGRRRPTAGNSAGLDGMPHINVGIGAWGDLFGADIHGKIYGTYTEGGRYALYTNGDRFTNGMDVHLTDVGEDEMAVSYTATSIEATINLDGRGRLNDGTRRIEFNSEFRKIIDPDKQVTVIVTPLGCCNGVYLSEVDENGFTVVENNGGRSDIEFMWIAIARRIDARDKDQLAREVVSSDYTTKLARGLHCDSDKLSDGEGLYFQNGDLTVGVHESKQVNEGFITLKNQFVEEPQARSYEEWCAAFTSFGEDISIIESEFDQIAKEKKREQAEQENPLENTHKPESPELPTPGPRDNIVK